jgi:hypothetical protein
LVVSLGSVAQNRNRRDVAGNVSAGMGLVFGVHGAARPRRSQQRHYDVV